ncbi:MULTISPECIES: hypothetical protein [Streptomyces]|uniref:Uncharacterized protein n=1 Tax=Streptomyces europaeiscabiei TaxID=146819 RepID=A0ABU4NTT0_9ACTN|nr:MULTISPECIES: hypothetical protein [Streptomyces]MBP5922153.1 hypothetical protein [Streptomyces sp. LBUM 1483]MDX3555215.1 hypothetical protein [Streptomyces europaeiscabiei]MDX3705229.1 hypothetical protein [Streptomyces europaeiscabiei]MDX3864360.1 hypothetical protein [Streptomyces europaeiscabiei]MDX3871558.1 hypothetical protein [Streptomyces europaeiscabiei]
MLQHTVPAVVDTRTWDGTRDPALITWLGEDTHRFDGHQLVLQTSDGDVYPEPGWTLLRWPDGDLTAMSTRAAAKRLTPTTEQQAMRAYGIETLGRIADEACDKAFRLRGQLDNAQTTCRITASLARDSEAAVQRVIDLYERWVKAGPPPLGTSINRWWDSRLAELRAAVLPEGQAAPAGLRGQVEVLRNDLRGITGARWIADALDKILNPPPPIKCSHCQDHRVVPDLNTRDHNGYPHPKPCPLCQANQPAPEKEA